MRRPSAFLPVAMSLAALATVLAHVVVFGTAHQADEGAAAHVFQLLMIAQVPIVAFFAFKWLPLAQRQALQVLALQAGAGLVARVLSTLVTRAAGWTSNPSSCTSRPMRVSSYASGASRCRHRRPIPADDPRHTGCGPAISS